jgi:hypothetical protein
MLPVLIVVGLVVLVMMFLFVLFVFLNPLAVTGVILGFFVLAGFYFWTKTKRTVRH